MPPHTERSFDEDDRALGRQLRVRCAVPIRISVNGVSLSAKTKVEIGARCMEGRWGRDERLVLRRRFLLRLGISGLD